MRGRANTGLLHFVQFALERREAIQHGGVTGRIATPRHFIFNGNSGYGWIGGGLFAGTKHAIGTSVIEVHFAFNHRDSRTLRAVVH